MRSKVDGLIGLVRGKSDGPVASVYPVRDVSSSMMMYSHICDMTAASALQERTQSSLNGYKAYPTELSSIHVNKRSQWNMSNAIHIYIHT
jgi:hypothetical protein